MLARLIYILFFFSGIAGLIYESIWSRYLKLFLGHSSYGQIWTLCIYMGGLGLGSFIAAKFLPKMNRLFLTYIIIEVCVAIGAFTFHPFYLLWTEWFYNVSVDWSPATIEFLKIVLVLSSTLPMAILLGMTFPLVSAGLMRIHGDGGVSALPRLYFTNSLGAALGVLIASYYTIPLWGTQGTLHFAGVINLCIALCFGLVLKIYAQENIPSVPAQAPPVISDEEEPSQSTTGDVKLWLLIAFGTGFTSFIYEVGWIRMLSLMMGSSTHSFDLMISSFVIGLALGAFVARKWMAKKHDHIQLMSWVQLAMGVCALSTLVLFPYFIEIMNEANHWFQDNTQGYWLWSLLKYILCLIWMVPTSFFAGMTLPIMTSFLATRTGDDSFTGKVYGFNTFGAISGAALAGLILIPGLQLKFTIGLAGILDVLTGVVLLAWYGYPIVKKYAFQMSILVLCLAPLLMKYNPHTLTAGVFRGHKPLDRHEKVEIRHGRTATISFHESRVHKYIKTNGKPDASIYKDKESPLKHDQLTQAATAFIPIQLMDRPYKAAIVGFGSGITAEYLLSDPLLESLDVIEIESEMVELAKGFLPDNQRCFNDPRINIHIGDARTFFHQVNKKYDLIISVPSNPWVSGVSSLFSHEFYRHIQRYMTPDGLLIQWLQLYEFNTELMMSIVGALESEFPAIQIYETPDNPDVIMVASPQEIGEMDLTKIATHPSLAQEFEKMHHPQDLFGPHRLIAQSGQWGDLLKSVPANSEFRPYVDHRAEEARFRHEYAHLWRGFRKDDWRWQSWQDPAYLSSPQYLSTLPAQDEDYQIREASIKYFLWDQDSLQTPLPEDTLFAQIRAQWRHHPFNPSRDSLWFNLAFEKHMLSFSEEIQAEYLFWKSLWNHDIQRAYYALNILKESYQIYSLERELVLAMFAVSLHHQDDLADLIIKMVERLIIEGEDQEWNSADLYWMQNQSQLQYQKTKS